MVASTGSTPQQVWSEWDLPSILAQNEYWRKYPPVHVLVAAYLGYEPPDPSDEGELTPDDLMSMFPMPG